MMKDISDYYFHDKILIERDGNLLNVDGKQKFCPFETAAERYCGPWCGQFDIEDYPIANPKNPDCEYCHEDCQECISREELIIVKTCKREFVCLGSNFS